MVLWSGAGRITGKGSGVCGWRDPATRKRPHRILRQMQARPARQVLLLSFCSTCGRWLLYLKSTDIEDID